MPHRVQGANLLLSCHGHSQPSPLQQACSWCAAMGKGPAVAEGGLGLRSYYRGKIEELEMLIKDKSHNLRRLEAQRNELNTQGAVGG